MLMNVKCNKYGGLPKNKTKIGPCGPELIWHYAKVTAKFIDSYLFELVIFVISYVCVIRSN